MSQSEVGKMDFEQRARAMRLAESRGLDDETAHELIYLRDLCRSGGGVETPSSVKMGIESIAKHIAAPARDCGIPEEHEEIVRRATAALLTFRTATPAEQLRPIESAPKNGRSEARDESD